MSEYYPGMMKSDRQRQTLKKSFWSVFDNLINSDSLAKKNCRAVLAHAYSLSAELCPWRARSSLGREVKSSGPTSSPVLYLRANAYLYRSRERAVEN